MLLADYQKFFLSAILENEPSAHQHFSSYGQNFQERLNIYKNNTIGVLTQNLIEKFPHLKIFLGDDYLHQCLRQYVLQNPPHDTDLNSYGQKFHLFLAQIPELTQFPWIPYIAKFEETLFLSEHADDDLAISDQEFEKLIKTVHPEELRLSLRHSVFLLQTPFSPFDIITLCKDETPNNSDILEALKEKNHFTLIFRPFLEVELIQLEYSEYLFLMEIQNEKTLLSATNQSIENNKNFSLQILLEKHLLLGTFSSPKTL